MAIGSSAAASVLGSEKAAKLIESFEGAEMLMVTLDDGTPHVVTTPGFDEFVVEATK